MINCHKLINCHDPSPQNITQLSAGGCDTGDTFKFNLISTPSFERSIILPENVVFNDDGLGGGDCV